MSLPLPCGYASPDVCVCEKSGNEEFIPVLTECWMYDNPWSKDVQTTLFHPLVYLVPLDALVAAFV